MTVNVFTRFTDLFARVTNGQSKRHTLHTVKKVKSCAKRNKCFPIKPHTVRRSVHFLHEIRPTSAKRSGHVKPPSTHRTNSPYSVIVHVWRATFLVFQGAVRRSALCSSFNFLCISAEHQQGRRPYFPAVLPLLRPVRDLTFHVLVEAKTPTPLLLAQLPQQARALPDLLDADFLRRLPQSAVHGLPILLSRSFMQRLAQRAPRPEERSTSSDVFSLLVSTNASVYVFHLFSRSAWNPPG